MRGLTLRTGQPLSTSASSGRWNSSVARPPSPGAWSRGTRSSGNPRSREAAQPLVPDGAYADTHDFRIQRCPGQSLEARRRDHLLRRMISTTTSGISTATSTATKAPIGIRTRPLLHTPTRNRAVTLRGFSHRARIGHSSNRRPTASSVAGEVETVVELVRYLLAWARDGRPDIGQTLRADREADVLRIMEALGRRVVNVGGDGFEPTASSV